MTDLVPVGFQLRADAATRIDGTVIVGGSPVRVLRLTPSGARQVAEWLAGKPIPDGVAARTLARKLLDAGIAHPDLITALCLPTRSNPDRAQPCGNAISPVPADVTVVIPVRDRHDELARCLAGLSIPRGATSRLRGGDPPDTPLPPAPVAEVIVVDDCSADPAAIEAIAAAAGARVIRRPVNGGPGAARNTGLAAATTELVAFLDSDCVPAPGWLDGLLPHFTDPAVGAVAPRIIPHEQGRGWLARYEGASSTLDMGSRPSIVRPGARISYVPGAALVVRRSAAGGGFDPGMHVGEDVDFVWRLSAGGWRVRYEPAAVMGHQHRVRLRPWFARRSDYGTSAALLEARHPGSVRPLYASWWTVTAWGAAIALRPRPAGMAVGVGITAAATALLSRRLARVTAERWPLPVAGAGGLRGSKGGGAPVGGTAWRLALRLAGGGTLTAGRPLGSALSRTWWPVAIPLAVAVPRLRVPVAALVLAPPLLDWADRRPPLDPARYVAARLLDDVAYSTGVWKGCSRRRSFRALLPVIGSRPAR